MKILYDFFSLKAESNKTGKIETYQFGVYFDYEKCRIINPAEQYQP